MEMRTVKALARRAECSLPLVRWYRADPKLVSMAIKANTMMIFMSMNKGVVIGGVHGTLWTIGWKKANPGGR
jgi:hypothetical protein